MDNFKKIEGSGGRICTYKMKCDTVAVYVGKIKYVGGSEERIAYCEECKSEEEAKTDTIEISNLLLNSDIGQIDEMQKRVIGISIQNNKSVKEVNQKLYDFVSGGLTLKEALENLSSFFKDKK